MLAIIVGLAAVSLAVVIYQFSCFHAYQGKNKEKGVSIPVHMVRTDP